MCVGLHQVPPCRGEAVLDVINIRADVRRPNALKSIEFVLQLFTPRHFYYVKGEFNLNRVVWVMHLMTVKKLLSKESVENNLSIYRQHLILF